MSPNEYVTIGSMHSFIATIMFLLFSSVSSSFRSLPLAFFQTFSFTGFYYLTLLFVPAVVEGCLQKASLASSLLPHDLIVQLQNQATVLILRHGKGQVALPAESLPLLQLSLCNYRIRVLELSTHSWAVQFKTK